MRVTLEEVAQFKTAVSTVASLVSKNSVSTIEQCVRLTAEEGVLTVTASVTDSHSISFYIPASVNQTGSVFILGSALKKITAMLRPKCPVFMTAKDGQLNYEVKPHGSISEALYHDQSKFPNFLTIDGSKDFDMVAAEDDMLPELFPLVAATSFNNKPIFFQSSEKKFEVYSQFSQTGYSKYITPTGKLPAQPCRLYLKPNLAKIIAKNTLGDSIDIFYNLKKNALAFSGEHGEIVIVGDTVTTNYFNATEHVLGLAVQGSVVVNHVDLLQAVSWQSYNAGVSEVVDLSVVDGHLTVNCGQTKEPARIVADMDNDFLPISLHLAPLQIALKSIGSEKSKLMPVQLVRLEERLFTLSQDTGVKIMTMCSDDETDAYGVAMLYEVKIVNK